jgi:alpha/beta superfamily hydrolase
MEEDVTVTVPAGPVLEARLSLPPDPRGALVVCHPHPLYGGDMDNPVVVRAVEVGQDMGLSTIRFNFRGVGRSTGAHAQGPGEQDDLRAALSTLRARLPAGRPVGLVGYSFGAWIAAGVAATTAPLAGLCLVAPPLAMLDFAGLDPGGAEVLLVAGTRDPYCSQAGLAALGARLPRSEVATIEGADHFFFGKLFPLGEAMRGWISHWAPR